MIEVVGVLVAAADREHASAEHIDKAVHDPRRIAPIREHPGQIVGQAETPLGHSQKHHAPVRGQATAIEGSCDFLGVNGWKRRTAESVIIDDVAGVAFAVEDDGSASRPDPPPHQRFTPRSPASQGALLRIRRVKTGRRRRGFRKTCGNSIAPYPTSDCRIFPIFSPFCTFLCRQRERMLVCYVVYEYPVTASIGAFEMRQIGFSKYEQQLSQRATEALKQMTELKQLRELVRLAEAPRR